MTDYDWPDDLAPYTTAFYLQSHTGGTESPLNRQTKTYELSAPRWLANLQLRGGYDGEDGAAEFGPRVDAFLAQLRGGTSRVALYDFRRPERRGSGTATAAAAAAGATSIALSGLDPLEVFARRGDYVGGDGRAHLLTGNVVPDMNGNATASFWPPLARSLIAGEARVGYAKSWFRLARESAGDAGSNSADAGDRHRRSVHAPVDQVRLWRQRDDLHGLYAAGLRAGRAVHALQ
jgi:hypothetical protein